MATHESAPSRSATAVHAGTGAHLRDDGVITVAGSDRLTYLHSLLSQHLESAQAGTVAEFLYLDAKGEHLAAGTAVVHAEVVHLLVPRETAADVADRLDRFRFMMDVTVTDRTGEWVVASLRDHDGGQVDAPGARSQPMTAAPHGDGLVIRDRDGGVDLLGPAAWVQERVAELDLPDLGEEGWHRWRIRAGRPAWGTEITPGRRSQELGLLATHVHLQKGCYPGQESIAKIHNLGRPRRALAVIEADGPLAPGDPVGEGRRPGEVTSAVADDGGAVALALVPLVDGALPATTVAGDGVPVRVLRAVGGAHEDRSGPPPGARR